MRDENQTHLEFVHYYTHLHLTPLILHAIIGAKRQMRMILNNDLGRLACNKHASTSALGIEVVPFLSLIRLAMRNVVATIVWL